MIPLCTISRNKSYRIEKIDLLDANERLHLASIGIAPEALIAKICPTPFKDPTEYLVDRVQLVALCRQTAAHIWVSEQP